MLERQNNIYDIVSLTHDTRQNIEDNKLDLMPYEPVIAVDTNELLFKDEQNNIVNAISAGIVNVATDLVNAKSYKIGDVVNVLGYYEKGDGAQHYRQKVDGTYTGEDAIGCIDGNKWKIVHNGEVNVSWFGYKNIGTEEQDLLLEKIVSNFKIKSYKTIDTLSNVFAQWKDSKKHPIAFFGDSTTDGATTADHIASVPWDYNYGGNITINNSPNSYPNLLQYLSREYANCPNATVYNAGFDSSWIKATGLGTRGFHTIFIEGFKNNLINVNFTDVKMIGCAYGVTDVISPEIGQKHLTVKAFKVAVEMFVNKCFLNGIQPFLVNPVYTLQTQASGRRSYDIIEIICNINKDIATRYNLEVYSLGDAISQYCSNGEYLEYYARPYGDYVHPTNNGHRAIAGYFFSKMSGVVEDIDQTFDINAGFEKIIGYSKSDYMIRECTGNSLVGRLHFTKTITSDNLNVFSVIINCREESYVHLVSYGQSVQAKVRVDNFTKNYTTQSLDFFLMENNQNLINIENGGAKVYKGMNIIKVIAKNEGEFKLLGLKLKPKNNNELFNIKSIKTQGISKNSGKINLQIGSDTAAWTTLNFNVKGKKFGFYIDFMESEKINGDTMKLRLSFEESNTYISKIVNNIESDKKLYFAHNNDFENLQLSFAISNGSIISALTVIDGIPVQRNITILDVNHVGNGISLSEVPDNSYVSIEDIFVLSTPQITY
ncbi:MAG: SGNH/GDSL hydrolase family protein [Paraclostridium sp.]